MTQFQILEKEIKDDFKRRIIIKKSKIVGKSSRELLDKRVVIAATLQAEKYIEKLQKNGGFLTPDEVKSLFILGKIATDNPIINNALQKYKEIENNSQNHQNTDIIKQNIFSKLLGSSRT